MNNSIGSFQNRGTSPEGLAARSNRRDLRVGLSKHAMFIVLAALFLTFWAQCTYAQATVVGTIPFATTGPWRVAVYETGNKFFVADNAGNVSIFDGTTHEVLQTIPVGAIPYEMVVNETYGKVYVGGNNKTGFWHGIISVINANTNELIRQIDVGDTNSIYFKLVNDEVHDKIYYGCYSGNGVIDVATDGFTAIPGAPFDSSNLEKIAVNMVTNEIFMTNYMENKLMIINGVTLAVENFAIPAGTGRPLDIAVNEVENKVYLTVGLVPDTGGKMGILILDRNTMGYKYAGADDLEPLAFNQSTNKLFTGVQVGLNASIIDGASDELTYVSLGPGGNGIGAIGILPSDDLAFLKSDAATYIVSGATKTLVQTIPTGHTPRGGVFSDDVAVNKTTGRVYVLSTERSDTSGEVTVLQATGPKAVMTSPAQGSTLTSSTETFTWTAGTGVTTYSIYIGSSPGGGDIYIGNFGTALTGTISGLPTDGSTLYVRLYSKIAGVWQFNDYTYTAASVSKAAMTSPAGGSTLTSSTVTFTWSGGSGAAMYALYVGTTAGGTELYANTEGTNLSKTLAGLPTNGSTVYVRLWSLISGVWQFNDYSYTAASVTKAAMTSPAGGSTLTSSTVTFTWSAGSGVAQCALYVGTTAGGTELYANTEGTNLSRTLAGLPTNGSTVYVRLWSLISGVWQFNDYTYTAASATKAAMTSPAGGSTLTSSTVTFAWSAGSGVLQCALYVGTTVGGTQIYANVEGGMSRTLGGLPTDGSTVYVRLWSLISGVWQFNDYTYTAASAIKAAMTSPVGGSTLTSSTVTFEWNAGSGVSQYALYVGTTAGGTEIYGNVEGGVSRTLGGLPTDGSTVYVRLWSRMGSTWQSNDYTYTAVSFSKAVMTAPTPGSTLTSSSQTFTWSAGAGVTTYSVYVGRSVGGGDIYMGSFGTGLSGTISGLPTDGSTLYVRLYSLIGKVWQFNDYTYTASGSGGFPLDGSWSGLTAQGKPISFTVAGGTITALSFGSHLVGSGCTSDSTTTSSPISKAITSNAFSWSTSPAPGALSYNISGSFSSSTAASGTLDFTVTEIPFVPGCYGSGSTTWSASKI